MSQRVTVQYSVPLEELDVEISRLYNQCMDNLNAAAMSDCDISNDILTVATIDRIETLRVELAKIDIRLAEVSSLINGYISYKTQPQQSNNNFEQSNPNISQEELMNKIDSFRSKLSDIEEEVVNTD